MTRVPLRERHLVERRVLLQAGVVDEDVDRAELARHALEHRLHLASSDTSAVTAMAVRTACALISSTSATRLLFAARRS